MLRLESCFEWLFTASFTGLVGYTDLVWFAKKHELARYGRWSRSGWRLAVLRRRAFGIALPRYQRFKTFGVVVRAHGVLVILRRFGFVCFRHDLKTRDSEVALCCGDLCAVGLGGCGSSGHGCT